MTSVKRVPITGVKRIPIIVDKTPWDGVYKKYINYIKYAAGVVYRTFLTESTEDLIQEGQLVLYKCWVYYGNKPEDELAKIIKASIWRRLQEVSGKCRFQTIDIETLHDQGREPGYVEDWDELLHQKDCLQKAAQLLVDEPVALTILKEFINPSDRTLWEAKMDRERKAMRRAQGESVMVPATIQPTRRAVQRAMELPRNKFEEHLKTVKEAVTVIYQPAVIQRRQEWKY